MCCLLIVSVQTAVAAACAQSPLSGCSTTHHTKCKPVNATIPSKRVEWDDKVMAAGCAHLSPSCSACLGHRPIRQWMWETSLPAAGQMRVACWKPGATLGLHSGLTQCLTVRPAERNKSSGIVCRAGHTAACDRGAEFTLDLAVSRQLAHDPWSSSAQSLQQCSCAGSADVCIPQQNA